MLARTQMMVNCSGAILWLCAMCCESTEERGHQVDWVAISNDDPVYWPGVEGSRELAGLVQRFIFDEDKIYRY